MPETFSLNSNGPFDRTARPDSLSTSRDCAIHLCYIKYHCAWKRQFVSIWSGLSVTTLFNLPRCGKVYQNHMAGHICSVCIVRKCGKKIRGLGLGRKVLYY